MSQPFNTSRIFNTNYIHPVALGATSADSREKNDCSVKALANHLSTSYESSFALHARAGRKSYSGTSYLTLIRAYRSKGLKCTVYGRSTPSVYIKEYLGMSNPEVKAYSTHRGLTVQSFIRDNSKGSFIVCITGHAFCVKDAEIIGGGSVNSLARIQCVWE